MSSEYNGILYDRHLRNSGRDLCSSRGYARVTTRVEPCQSDSVGSGVASDNMILRELN
jgi:hypothetical protein